MEYNLHNEMHLNQTVQVQWIKFPDKNLMRQKGINEQKGIISVNEVKSGKSRKAATVKLNSEMKLSESLQLLSNRMLNISEVAYSLGYNDPKYFSKCFKNEFGMTPREYRDCQMDRGDAEKDSEKDQKFVREMTSKIIDNMSFQHFTVDQLADKLNISYSNLYRKVKASIGVTPSDFIRKIRIYHAKNLLDMNGFTISDIAFSTGFCNASYFSRCFKSELGLFPAEYIGSGDVLKNIG